MGGKSLEFGSPRKRIQNKSSQKTIYPIIFTSKNCKKKSGIGNENELHSIINNTAYIGQASHNSDGIKIIAREWNFKLNRIPRVQPVIFSLDNFN